MCVRTLMLLQLLAVLTLMANYCLELRDYPRDGDRLDPGAGDADHGGLDVPDHLVSSPGAAARLAARSASSAAPAVCGGCPPWTTSRAREQVALMIGCWGLFVGLFPPVFLQDEVEGLDRRDFLYGGALAVVVLIVPIVVIPTMTSTIVSAWSDRAFGRAADEPAGEPPRS